MLGGILTFGDDTSVLTDNKADTEETKIAAADTQQ